MRLLYAADLHLGAHHLTSAADQEGALDAIVEIVRAEGVQAVLLGGDLTHHARPTPETLRMLGSFLAALGCDVVISGGNHDPEIPGVAQLFRGRIHTAWSAPIIAHLQGVDVCAMPFLPDAHVRAQLDGQASKEEIAAALTRAAHDILRGFRAQRMEGVPQVFLGHGTVAGSATSSGYQLGFIGGTEWRFAIEDLAEFAFAGVGHIHRPHEPAANVAVPGGLLPLDFSEVEPKRVIVVDVAAGEPTVWRSIEIPGPRPRTIELNGRQDVEGFLAIAYHPSSAGLTGQLVRIRASVDEACAREHPAAELERAGRDAGAALVQVELDVAREDRRRNTELTADLDVAHAMGQHLGHTVSDKDELGRLSIRADEQLRARAMTATGTLGGSLEVVRLGATDFLGLARADLVLEDDVIALSGPVGQGKSSLGCDLLRFALSGMSRVGARNAERLVRNGADSALVDVELRDSSGRRLRIVRKIKLDGHGRASTTLDVMEQADAD